MSQSHAPDSKNENVYLNLTLEAKQVTGRSGMMQYHFSDESSANLFLDWIKKQKDITDLEKVNIQKTNLPDEKNTVYIIRLTSAQKLELIRRSIKELKEIISPASLSQVEVMQCANKLCNIDLKPDQFIQVLDGYHPNIINAALQIAGILKYTALHTAARYQPGEAFIQLIAKASSQAISDALPKSTNDQWTALHMAARYQPGEAFIQLIAKTSSQAISEALRTPDHEHWTALHLAARYQPGEVFIQLIAKASPDAISEALLIANTSNDTALHDIVWFQPEEAVLKLIERASAESLSRACLIINNLKQSVLECGLPYLPASAIAPLLNKINDEALKVLFTHENKSPRLLRSMMSYIVFEPSFQTEPLLSRLCDQLSPDIVNFCCEAWLQGYVIPPAVLKALQPHLLSAIQKLKQSARQNTSQLAEFEKTLEIWRAHAPDQKDQKAGSPQDEKAQFTTRLGSLISLNTRDEKQLQQLLYEGLKSPADFHLMKKLSPGSIASQLADDMRKNGILYSGAPIDLDIKSYREVPEHFRDIIKQGYAVLKIIKEGDYKNEQGQTKNDWKDFIQQLSDYSYRPTLRKVTDKSQLQSKFHHRTGDVIDFKDHKAADKKKTYTASKKQSATLLSRNLNTSVFGEHDANRHLVGILADISAHVRLESKMPADRKPNEYIYIDGDEKGQEERLFYIDDDKTPHPVKPTVLSDEKYVLPQKKLADLTEKEKSDLIKWIEKQHDRRIIKAMFTRDKGTFHRKWLGDKKSVEEYAREIKHINVTDLDKFRAISEKHPNRLNEMLVKFSRSSLLGILRVSDTAEAKAIAITRQKELKDTLKIDVPIIFYNRFLNQASIDTLFSAREEKMRSVINLNLLNSRLLDGKCKFTKQKTDYVLDTLINENYSLLASFLKTLFPEITTVIKHKEMNTQFRIPFQTLDSVRNIGAVIQAALLTLNTTAKAAEDKNNFFKAKEYYSVIKLFGDEKEKAEAKASLIRIDPFNRLTSNILSDIKEYEKYKKNSYLRPLFGINVSTEKAVVFKKITDILNSDQKNNNVEKARKIKDAIEQYMMAVTSNKTDKFADTLNKIKHNINVCMGFTDNPMKQNLVSDVKSTK